MMEKIKIDRFADKLALRLEESFDSCLQDYFTYLRFKSISSEPEFASETRDCALWIQDLLAKFGFEVELWETENHPIIFATFLQAGPEKPTLLIYNHYDVQPVDPLELWTSPPFEPVVRDGEVYARGAQDNKGQSFYVLQALKLLLEETGTLPINIKLCIEGEEEYGSKGLSSLLASKKKELRADYLAIVDLGIRLPNTPAITLGVRGLVTFDLSVESAKVDLHSGSHGGVSLNPIHSLVELLSSARDEQGKITIPGFYDEMSSMSKREHDQICWDFDAAHYEQEVGAPPLGGELSCSPLERGWLRPTLEINGICGGYTGKGFKTVIPSKAFAKISCRLVPGQDPQKIAMCVQNYFLSQAPKGVKVEVIIHSGMGRAVRVSPESTVVKAFSLAFEEVFKKKCTYILEGASIPIVSELSQVSGAETILLGLGLTTDQIHAPNEHFGLDRIRQGILVMATAIMRLN